VKVSFLARERDLSFRSVPYRTISYRDRDRDRDRDRIIYLTFYRIAKNIFLFLHYYKQKNSYT
jgi:hypothetical protein